MIKLNAGVSRKVGEPNYGSRGASVNVELELESSVVNDTEALYEKIRRLFALAKKSVDDELGISTSLPGNGGGPANVPSTLKRERPRRSKNMPSRQSAARTGSTGIRKR